MAKFRVPRSAVEQWQANIDAIATLKKLEREEREPTPEEQETLARFSGFGNSAFEQAFQPESWDRNWRDRGDHLRRLTTPEEYDAIVQNRRSAHYTTPEVIEGVWGGIGAMNALGKGSGPGGSLRILEPSAGSGRFIGLGPASLVDESSVTAVEKDNLTGRILRAAYPAAQVHVGGFEEAPVADDAYDLAISNVPFDSVGVHDPAYLDDPHVTRRIHNYFFIKALDKLRPGGVVAFITTHNTLDAPAAKQVREEIAERADFLGAVRLPQEAFHDTQVVTDVIYLRKRREGEPPGDAGWVETVKVELPNEDNEPQAYSVNRWIAKNPDAVLGTASGKGSMYGGNEYTVSAKGAYGGVEQVPDRLKDLAHRIGRSRRFDAERSGAAATATPTSNRPVGQYFHGDDGALMVVNEDRQEVKAAFRNQKQPLRVTAMMRLRDLARELLDAERAGVDEITVAMRRRELKEAYDQFVGEYGRLNANANASLFRSDPDSAFVAGLERKQDDAWVDNTIFERRVIGATATPSLSGIDDAFKYHYANTGRVDLDRIGELVGADPSEVERYIDERDLAFMNPATGSWVARTDYLTGDVREKLRAAQDAAEDDPRYRENVAALEAAQPADIPASDIKAVLGASWIPARDLNQWVAEKFNTHRADDFYTYDFERGRWVEEKRVTAPPEMLVTEWGTRDAPAPKILKVVLDGKPVVVTRKIDDKEVVDQDASAEAQQRAEKMQDDFERWVWEDDDRRERLAAHYNETFNNSVPRNYDGSHQSFPGMSELWQNRMRPHQRDAIFRVVQDGTVLLAHEVGFGKTAVMAGGGMERKRLGLADKPMYVIPKATHAQFKEQFQEIYPDARILFVSDFSKGQREEFLNRAQTGDWDALIVTYEQFKAIPVRPSTEIAFREEQLRAFKQARHEAVRKRQTETSKDLGRAIEAEEKKIKDLQARIARKQDAGPYFEDLGVDQVFVDEADNFKNLQFTTAMRGRGTGIKGLPDSKSQRAFDMFMKTQYLLGNVPGTDIAEEKRDGFAKQGVVFATGTPIANTIAEMWTMMRYLDLKNLRKRKLHNFDTWAKDFGRVKTDIEVNAAGRYVPTARFARFKNAPELSKIFQDVADMRVASEVPQMLEAQPRLRDEGGRPQRISVAAPSSYSQERYRDFIGERADAISAGQPLPMISSVTGDEIEDNMLKLSSDARKASLDIRMVDNWPYDDAPRPNPEGKIQMAAENAARIFHEETPDKGTQLIFLDLGTPKSGSGKDTGEDEEVAGEELTGREADLVNDAYNIIKRELVNRGVPEDQVAFIHDYNTKPRKVKLFQQVNDGDVRVLIGSTAKLGVGVNVQERAVALHHIDVPWRPRDVEQREGRIIRQGNVVYGPKIDRETGDVLDPGKGVQIFTYVQEGSFDEFMWGAVEEKAQSIKSIVKRNVTERELEDIDPLVLSASEAKALASGDPRILKLANLNKKLTNLKLKERAHRQSQLNLATQRYETEKRVAALESRVPKLQADRERAGAVLDAEFQMTVGRRSLDKTADANAALLDALDGLQYKGAWKRLGSYGPFTIEGANLDTGHRLALVGPDGQTYQTDDIKKLDGANVVRRARNVLNGIDAEAEDAERKLQQNLKSQDYYRNQESLPFDLWDDLQDTEREFAQLQADISGREAPTAPRAAPVAIAAQTLDEYDVETASEGEWQAASDAVAAELMERFRTERDFQFPDKAEKDALIAQRLRQDWERERRAEIEAMPPPELEPADEAVLIAAEGSPELGSHLERPEMRDEYRAEYLRLQQELANPDNQTITSEDQLHLYAQQAVDDLAAEGFFDTEEEAHERERLHERELAELQEQRKAVVQRQLAWALERLAQGQTVTLIAPSSGPIELSPKVWQSWEATDTPLLKISASGSELMMRQGKQGYVHVPMTYVPTTEVERFGPEPITRPASTFNAQDEAIVEHVADQVVAEINDDDQTGAVVISDQDLQRMAEVETPAATSDEYDGLAKTLATRERNLKRADRPSRKQIDYLTALAQKNPDLAARLGMQVVNGMPLIYWDGLPKKDASRLIDIFLNPPPPAAAAPSEAAREEVADSIGEDVGNAIAERPGPSVVIEDAEVPPDIAVSVSEGPNHVIEVGGDPEFVEAVFDELESEEVPTVIREDMTDGIVETEPEHEIPRAPMEPPETPAGTGEPALDLSEPIATLAEWEKIRADTLAQIKAEVEARREAKQVQNEALFRSGSVRIDEADATAAAAREKAATENLAALRETLEKADNEISLIWADRVRPMTAEERDERIKEISEQAEPDFWTKPEFRALVEAQRDHKALEAKENLSETVDATIPTVGDDITEISEEPTPVAAGGPVEVAYDTDGDGVPDRTIVDSDGDGEIDTVEWPAPSEVPPVADIIEATTDVEPPEIAEPLTGTISVRDLAPPDIPTPRSNDSIQTLKNKWAMGDASLDRYAAQFGIAIPNDAAKLFINPDGSLGMERLTVGSESPTKPAAFGGGGGGGGGSGGGRPPTPCPPDPAFAAGGLWDTLTMEEKIFVVAEINRALAARARLARLIVEKTGDETGGIDDLLKTDPVIGHLAKSAQPCAPVAIVRQSDLRAPAARQSPRPSHVWHSRKEMRSGRKKSTAKR